MAAEAERLIEARRKIQRPANPVTLRTNQIHDPRTLKSDPQKALVERMSMELGAALRRRDQGIQR